MSSHCTRPTLSWSLSPRIMFRCLTLTTIVCLSLARWPYIRHGEETNRYRQCIHGFESPSPILSKSLSEFLHFVLTWPGFDSRTRDPFTTSPTEPSVVHVCTVASPEIHFTPQSHSSQSYQLPPPSAIPTPSVHTKKTTVVLFNAVVLGSMSQLSVLLVEVA